MSDQTRQTDTAEETTKDDQGNEWRVLQVRHQILAWENVGWRNEVLDPKNAGTAGRRMENWLGSILAGKNVSYQQFRTWPEPKYGPYIDEVQRQADDIAGDFEITSDGGRLVHLKHKIGPLERIRLRPPNAIDRERPGSHPDNPLLSQLEAVIGLYDGDYNLTLAQLSKQRIGDNAIVIAAYMSFR